MWLDSDLQYEVFNLLEEAPDDVLRRLYLNLEKLTLNGDEFAPRIQERLKIIVSLVCITKIDFVMYSLFSYVLGHAHMFIFAPTLLTGMHVIRLLVGMALLAGFLELFRISNYLSRLQLLQCPWELETTFHLLLVG